MAKGTDSEEFALLSGPRTGLKREFAFALKSQTEVSGSYGRTRGRRSVNSPSSDGDMGGSSRKRFKSSIEEVLNNGEPMNDAIEGACKDNEEPLKDSVESSCREESKSDLDKRKCDELPQSDSLKCLKSPRTKESNNNGEVSCMEEGTGIETPIMIDNKSEANNDVMEKPLKRFTRFAWKHKEMQKITDDCSMVNSVSPEKPMRRFTRSVLGSPNAEQMVMDGNGQVESKSFEKAQSPCPRSCSSSEPASEQIVMDEKSLSCCGPSGSEPQSKQMLMDENCEVQTTSLVNPCDPSVSKPTAEPMVVDGSREVVNPSQEKTANRLTCAALEPKEDKLAKDGSMEVHNASQEKTPQRFTRAALVKDNSRGVHEKTPRRFTRSAMEPQSDQMVMDENRKVQTSLEKPCHPSVLEPTAEQMVLDGNREVENPLQERTPKRFTRSALEPKDGQMVKDDSREVPNASQEKSPKRFTRSALVKAEQVVKDDSREVHNTSPEKSPRRFTPSVMEPKTELMVITENSDQPNALSETPTMRFTSSALESKTDPSVVDDNKDPQNAPSEEPAGRLTHSVLKPKAELIVMSSNCDLPNALPTEPVRRIRFTRSALKPKEEQPEISAIVTTGGSSTISEETCKSKSELLGAKNKLEMKMSKKIAWPLDTLETTLQNAIGSSPINDSTICVICKGHVPSDFRKALQLCDSCREAKKTLGITARTVGTHARLSKPGLTPGSLSSASQFAPSQNKSIKGKITRKDLRLHKLVFEEDGLPDGTELAYYMHGKKLLEGYKKGFGIFCRCCNSEVSASTFEAHAGCSTRRKPFHQIYTSNGVSLHELSISLSKVRKFSSNDNDDLCGICGDGGNLLLCDGCPRAFHKDCVGQSSIPQGKWYCPYCQKIFEKEQLCANNENAKAAGRISGVDPMEEISKRCIRIVKTIEPEVGGCVLCRCHSFCRVGFGPRTVILCDQCEKEFHVGCLKDHNMADLKELPKGKWFCRPECNRIHSVLQKLIIRGSEELPDSISCVIKGRLEAKCLNSDAGIDVRWRVLNGKVATPESRSLLSKAVTIFHDRFDPIVDSTTGRDLIPSMVYGRKSGDQDYGGMYCAVLTVNFHVVSAGILRIFGQEIAELPLVATSADYQGQGYFQSLFCCIERLLGFLNVKNLVLPAAEEAEAIWTQKFGFEKISNEQLSNYRKHCQMTTFQGTCMLQKPVPKCRVVERPKRSS